MSCPFSSGKATQGGSSCPFSGKGGPAAPKEPEAEWFEACYSVPYISPFYTNIEHTLKKFSCEAADSTYYLLNSMFHESRITHWRTQPIVVRLLLAEELKQGGNRDYASGKLKDALLNYDSGLGLLKYLTKAEGKLVVHEDELVDTQEIASRDAVRKSLLINSAITLVKLKHFYEAQGVLETCKTMWPSDSKIAALDCWLKAEDLSIPLPQLESAIEAVQLLRETEDSGFLTALQGHLQARKTALTLELRQLYHKFLTLSQSYEGHPQCSYTGLEFEHQVLLILKAKYTEVLKFCIEMERPTHQSHRKLQILKAVLTRMNFLYKLSAESPPVLMKTVAEEVGVDLEDQKFLDAFESIKRRLIVEAFSDGEYDQDLLSYCIDQCTKQRRSELARQPRKSGGFCTWQLALSLLAIFVAMLYLYIGGTGPSKSFKG